jgi:hypothetical protein
MADTLPKFRISNRKMYGRYLVLEATDNPSDTVQGISLQLKKEDLLKADVYEGPAYKRILVTLKSGRKAWLYVEKNMGE